MIKDFIKTMKLNEENPVDIGQISPLVLAYIGDAVYELFVRTYLLYHYDYPVDELHRRSIRLVNAEAQAKVVHLMKMEWDEEEMQIIKRGRNQKSGTTPKNAKLIDYKYATGFEALVGYLFLTGRAQRLMEIVRKSFNLLEGVHDK